MNIVKSLLCSLAMGSVATAASQTKTIAGYVTDASSGETYTLRAKANGLEDVYSIVTVPDKPKADFRIVSVEQITESHNYYGPYEIIDINERV